MFYEYWYIFFIWNSVDINTCIFFDIFSQFVYYCLKNHKYLES